MKSILDPTFRYVPSVQTDIRKTFARIRREMKEKKEKELGHDRKILSLQTRFSR